MGTSTEFIDGNSIVLLGDFVVLEEGPGKICRSRFGVGRIDVGGDDSGV